MSKILFLKLPVIVVMLLIAAIFTSVYSFQQRASADVLMHAEVVKAPIAASANNIYTAWPNNDTGHWGVFFAKSTDGGKTLGKTIMLSAPSKGKVVNTNVDITSSGSNVVVTWWTNKTGTLMPVFKASNDNGDTFGKTMTLNSTSAP